MQQILNQYVNKNKFFYKSVFYIHFFKIEYNTFDFSTSAHKFFDIFYNCTES